MILSGTRSANHHRLPAAGDCADQSCNRVFERYSQLERFTDLYLPSGPADPAWILWTEAWARAPHDAEMSGFLDELMRPWYDDLAEIVQRGEQEGTFGLQVPSGDFTICFCALLDGLAMIHLNQKPYLPRERLIELAMATARAQLTPAAPSDTE